MDRPEIKILAFLFCALVIASRLPGIFWPEKLKRFLAHYAALGNAATRCIGALFLCLASVTLFILFKTMTLAKLVVLAGSAALLASGIVHLYPSTLRNLLGNIEKRSALTLRLFSIASISAAAAVVLYLTLAG